jgi:methyl-accepting chemotaxis protein
MDQTTQQNAALVEQSAAAAQSLTNQARQLVQAVASFKLSRDELTRFDVAVDVPDPLHSKRSTDMRRTAKTPARTPIAAKPCAKTLAVPAAATRPTPQTTAAASFDDTADWAKF